MRPGPTTAQWRGSGVISISVQLPWDAGREWLLGVALYW
jgi:hypothetical protein